VSSPGERFAYNNSGFVLLALMVERVLGQSFEDIVQDIVLNPAEMAHTGFVRSDRLPGDVAIGYMTSENSIENKLWTNALHLPVMGLDSGCMNPGRQ